jgi:hypothetical protein
VAREEAVPFCMNNLFTILLSRFWRLIRGLGPI